MNRRKRCWFHRWKNLGHDGHLTLLDECIKCHRQRAFDGVQGEWKVYPPNSWKPTGKDQQ